MIVLFKKVKIECIYLVYSVCVAFVCLVLVSLAYISKACMSCLLKQTSGKHVSVVCIVARW